MELNIFTDKKGLDLIEEVNDYYSYKNGRRKRTWSDATYTMDHTAIEYKTNWQEIVNSYKKIKDIEASRSKCDEDELSQDDVVIVEDVDYPSDDASEPPMKKPKYERCISLEDCNDLAMFFKVMETIVSKFPPNKIAEVRARISEIVTQTKWQCLTRRN